MINYNIKAALFDLDGVVAFSDKYHYAAWKKLAEENGWLFNEKLNDRLRGVSRMESLQTILDYNAIAASEADKVKYAETKNRYYKDLIQNINETDLYEGVVEFIEKLRKRNIKTALCSSSKNAGFIVQKLNIEKYFDAVVSGNDIQNTKPDPEIFLLGAEKINVPPFHCVVFEDSAAGIEAAHNAGMKSCGVGNEEVEFSADEFIKKYSEIDIENFLESGKKQFCRFDGCKIYEDSPKQRNINHTESIFALGNGYLGMRGTYEEENESIKDFECPGMYINGVFEKSEIVHAQTFKGFATHNQFTVNLSDWRLITVFVDGEKVCFSNGKMLRHERYIDMKNGLLAREFVWQGTNGKQILVKFERILSMTRIHSGAICCSVMPLNFSGKIEIASEVRFVNPIGGIFTTECVENGSIGESEYAVIRTKGTKIRVCSSIAHRINVRNAEHVIVRNSNGFEKRYSVSARRNKEIIFEKHAAFFTDNDETDCIIAAAVSENEKNLADGFGVIRAEQSAFWKKHWKNGNIQIHGNDRDDAAVRFNLFHLRQQIPSVSGFSVGATGLTGESYSGKVFWDTEMYIMPYLNYTEPSATKGLIMYRYKILDKARERARQMEGNGALYSWCSIDGEETSVVFEASTAEYHLESDIAYAIERYVKSTDDYEFLFDFGAEIVFETAKYMYSRGFFSEENGGRFCLNAVCGPDEYACGVNNNFYTNMMLRRHFYYAADVFSIMRERAQDKLSDLCRRISVTSEDVAGWKNAADKMYFRYNEKLGIYEQDDSFVTNDTADMNKIPKNFDIRNTMHPLNLWRIQVLKQADVLLLMFLQGDRYTKSEKKRCYEYYEPRTNHGSSLSAAVHCIMAYEIEKQDDAYRYFRSSAYMDLADFKHNTSGGLHMACLGGVWMSIANGCLGMRDYDGGLQLNPQCPSAWSGYELDILYRGSRIHIFVNRENAKLTLTSGEPVRLFSGGNEYFLDSELNIKI